MLFNIIQPAWSSSRNFLRTDGLRNFQLLERLDFGGLTIQDHIFEHGFNLGS